MLKIFNLPTCPAKQFNTYFIREDKNRYSNIVAFSILILKIMNHHNLAISTTVGTSHNYPYMTDISGPITFLVLKYQVYPRNEAIAFFDTQCKCF